MLPLNEISEVNASEPNLLIKYRQILTHLQNILFTYYEKIKITSLSKKEDDLYRAATC